MKAENQVATPMTIRENKLALVERLADDLAHEIKNPLHSMVINLEVLRRRLARLGPESADELLRYVGILGSELERVNRRVDLLLRMVRPSRDGEELTTLAAVLQELHELVELECERNEVGFRVEPPAAALRARFPRAATRQLILSLVLETLDSLAPGDTLAIHSECDADGVRLLVFGLATDPGRAASGPAEEPGSYLFVARELARRVGATIELSSASHRAGSGAPGPPARYVLTLPCEA